MDPHLLPVLWASVATVGGLRKWPVVTDVSF